MRDTIKNHKDFSMAENDPVWKCPLFVARAKPAALAGDARYGLIATKRTLRHAVDRNRAKRLLRVWIRANDARMSPEFDYIFIVRSPILDAGLEEGVDLMKRAVKNLNKSVIAGPPKAEPATPINKL